MGERLGRVNAEGKVITLYAFLSVPYSSIMTLWLHEKKSIFLRDLSLST